MDQQVKVRGYRIELGEIEAALAAQTGVQQSVVVVDETDDNKRLIAYIACGNPRPEVDQLRAELSRTLPDYMLPQPSFCWMPYHDAERQSRSQGATQTGIPAGCGVYVAARSVIEHEIAGMWRDLLKLDRVGMNDNFFDLGGHSLLIVRLQSRLQERFGCDLPLVKLFQKPTIASLAACLESQHMVSCPHAARSTKDMKNHSMEIAIIGIAGRFPDARNIDEFWHNLERGHESLVEFSNEELLAAGVPASVAADPNYVKRGTVLEGRTCLTPLSSASIPARQKLSTRSSACFSSAHGKHSRTPVTRGASPDVHRRVRRSEHQFVPDRERIGEPRRR